MSTRILLADDHDIVREGLKLLLQREGFEVIGEAANGQDAIRLARENCPDVAVLDYGMPLLNGIGAAREIMQACPRTKVILLTMHTDDHYVLEALRMGIKGFVVKTQAPADLIRSIHEVLSGMVYLSPRVSRTLVQAYLAKSALPADPLTPREREVLQLVAAGRPYGESRSRRKATKSYVRNRRVRSTVREGDRERRRGEGSERHRGRRRERRRRRHRGVGGPRALRPAGVRAADADPLRDSAAAPGVRHCGAPRL